MADNLRNREFLGQGLAFPLQVNPRGAIALAAGERDIEQSIRIILETAPGERVMRPEFGCRIHELIFAPNNAATEGLMIHYVKEALDRWEPRIEILHLGAEPNPEDPSRLDIVLDYRVRATASENRLVFPFNLLQSEV